MPEELRGTGNVERIITRVVPDYSTGYALWLKNEVDDSRVPLAERDAHMEKFPDETMIFPTLATWFVGFSLNKPPFDNVQVRRAFGAAVDRETFVNDVRQGWGLPMQHFAPPGVFGAPPIDEVGMGFDPEYAQAELAEAGYADCQGFPQVTIMAPDVQGAPDYLQFLQAQWEEHLDCPSESIQLDQLPLPEFLAAVREPAETRPHMWIMGRAADYPDENNFVGDVLWCEWTVRECSQVDDLIVEAREESDPQRRIELYRQIEEGFFGPQGLMPIAPVLANVDIRAVHSWLQCPKAGGNHNCTIDWEAKKAARGE
jgi:ABC-type transport system substrate-binding protein